MYEDARHLQNCLIVWYSLATPLKPGSKEHNKYNHFGHLDLSAMVDENLNMQHHFQPRIVSPYHIQIYGAYH
jgi:hypothetical protein